MTAGPPARTIPVGRSAFLLRLTPIRVVILVGRYDTPVLARRRAPTVMLVAAITRLTTRLAHEASPLAMNES